MLDVDLAAMRRLAEKLDYRPLFVTVSGAHLYGFPSADSDVDLRGCHQLPLRRPGGAGPAESDAGAQDRLRRHGGRVGQPRGWQVPAAAGAKQRLHPGADLFPDRGPGPGLPDELRPLARGCITRHHYHHYRGFYATQRKLIAKQEPKRAKPLLYAYRVLMTGIHLLRTGEVEANLLRLNEHFGSRSSTS